MPLTLFGPFIFNAIQRKNHTKGYHQMVHRTDEGYAVGQHGGEELDKITISFKLFGGLRDVMKQMLTTLADLAVPLPFISTLVTFQRVRVLTFDFGEVVDKANQISGSLTFQRIRISKLDTLLSWAFGLAKLVGSMITMSGPESIAMLTKEVQQSVVTPLLNSVNLFTYIK